MKGNQLNWSKVFGLSFAVAILVIPLSLCAQKVPIAVPPEPVPKPMIPSLSDVDTDGNRIDDLIDTAVFDALDVLEDPRASLSRRIAARASLHEVINVELVFSRQITLRELKQFIAAGGEVTYIMRANYGWIGRIPRAKIYNLPFLAASGFVGVVADRPVVAYSSGAAAH